MLPHRSTRTSPGSNFDPTLSLQTGVGFDYILVRMFTLLTIFMLGVQSLTVELAPFVLANSRSLPPKASVWVGEAPHYFLGGQATLFCGSHGVISGTGDPPDRQGQTSVIQYNAIFSGELTLNPPLTNTTRHYTIKDPIRMTEQITAQGGRGATNSYSTELTAVVFSGSSFPENVSVRESPRRRSVGTASISRQRNGMFKIQSSYEVWLEISVDGGRSWQLASDAVTMRLEPEVETATISTRKAIE